MKIKRIHFLWSVIWLTGCELYAQIYQAGFSYQSNYFLKHQAYNPAYVGFRDLPSLMVSGQIQNHYDQQKPRFYYASIQNDFPAFKSGLGLTAQYYNLRDNYDTHQMMAEAQWSYIFQQNDIIKTRLGLGFGVVNYFTKLTNTPGVNQPIPQAVLDRRTKLNVNIGLLTYTDHFYLGFGMQHTNKPTFDFSDGISTYINPYSGNIVNYNPQTTFLQRGNISAGYKLILGDRFSLTPNLMAQGYFGSINYRITKGSLSADVGLVASYNDRILAAINYKANDPIFLAGMTVGLKLAQTYFISFSYDLPKGDVTGKHQAMELGLGLFFGGQEVDEE